MANILLLDGNDVAQRAMRGILNRGHHRCAVAATSAEAWTQLRQLVKIDLLFTEAKLKGESGVQFIQQLRADCFLRHLPVVVYTAENDHDLAKRALALQAQNYLIKPFSDEAIYGEIAKAAANPWRQLHFEEERSFCAQLGLKTEALHQMLEELMAAMAEARTQLETDAGAKNLVVVTERISALSERAEMAGVWGVVDCLKTLQARADAGNWDVFKQALEGLEYGRQLIYCQVHPDYVPEVLVSEDERKEQQEAKARAFWLETPVDGTEPLVPAKDIFEQLDRLPSWPVIDTAAAAFQMTVGGQGAALNRLMDLVASDPGLSAQVLIAANRLEREEMTPIEDPRMAVGLLGDVRLAALGRAMPLVEERHMHIPPVTWPHFWTFQVGVARMAQFASSYFEFHELTPRAYTAGLLHDLGKLLLLRLHPYGFQAMVRYARQHLAQFHVAERMHIGCTTREMADRYATQHGLPAVFCNVIRWVETPEEAAEDTTLVAVVSLAREVCLHNHVGYCGDTPKDYSPPVDETAAWRVLQNRVFPSFNLPAFESKARAFCMEMKQELAGRLE